MALTSAGRERSSTIVTRASRCSSQTGHSFNVCCAVSLSAAQWWHRAIGSLAIRLKYLPKHSCPVNTCVILCGTVSHASCLPIPANSGGWSARFGKLRVRQALLPFEALFFKTEHYFCCLIKGRPKDKKVLFFPSKKLIRY